MAHHGFTATFHKISIPVRNVDAKILDKLQKFVVVLYGGDSETLSVNEACRDLYASKSRPLTLLPPTIDALKQAILRSIYLADIIWGQAIESVVQLPSPENWDWMQEGGKWIP